MSTLQSGKDNLCCILFLPMKNWFVAFALVKTEGLDDTRAAASYRRPRPWYGWAPNPIS